MLHRFLFAASIAVASVLPGAAEAESVENTAVATFAGGCFWCMEEVYDAVEGVISTTSGFIGGHVENPSYRDVVTGGTGHAEAVQVVYDPGRVSYAELLDEFWRNVDPLDAGGQFCDRGSAYRSGVFVHDEEQQRLAEATKAGVAERFAAPIATEIAQATEFYVAEDYHQGYYRKNPLQYLFYKTACGREARLSELWGGG